MTRRAVFILITMIFFFSLLELIAQSILTFSWMPPDKNTPKRYPRPGIFSEDQQIALPVPVKQPEIYRIVCMGDSVTYGLRVTAGNAYPEHLEGILNTHGKNVEVINCGRLGHSLLMGIQQYLDTVRDMTPDLIIASYGINDHFYNPVPDSVAIKIPDTISMKLQCVMNRSGVYRIMKRLILPPVKGDMDTVRVPKKTFESYLEFFIHRIREDGSGLVLMNQLSANYDLDLIQYSDIIKKVGARRNIDVIDLYKEFPLKIGCEASFLANEQNLITADQIRNVQPLVITNRLLRPYFIDGYHYSERGYEIIAQIVSQNVLARWN